MEMIKKIDNLLGDNNISIKELNKKQILKIILERGPISRIDISKYLKISRPTTTFYINELISSGLIEETGKSKSTPLGGKKAVLIEFNEKAGFILGLMIGIKNTRIAITDLNSNIVKYVKIPTEHSKGPAHVIEKIIKNITSIIKESKILKEQFIGIGIGVPGLLDPNTGIVIFSPNLQDWTNIKLKEEIEKHIALPVFIENECRVQAIAEKKFGLAKDLKDFVCFETGIGIGTGVFIKDKLLSGIKGMAGELGHLTVNIDDNRICHCGNAGCLESLCSSKSLLDNIQADFRKSDKKTDIDFENLKEEDIYKLYEEENEIVTRNVDKNAEYLGIGISNAIKIFSPELIIIQGIVINFGEKYLNAVKESVEKNTFPMVKEVHEIQFSKMGENIGLTGITSIVFEKIFNLYTFDIPGNYILKKE